MSKKSGSLREGGHKVTEGYRVADQPERRLMTTRNLIIGTLAAAGGIYLSIQYTSSNKVEPKESATSKVAAAEQLVCKPSLEAITKTELDNPPLIQREEKKSMKLYEESDGNPLAAVESLHKKAHIDGNTEAEDAVVRKFMQEFGATGFAEDLQALVEANDGQNKENELVFIPIVHGSEALDNTPDKKRERQEGWDDVEGILKCLADQPHRIYFEGSKAGPVYARRQQAMEKERQKLRDMKLIPEEEQFVMEELNKRFRAGYGRILTNPQLNLFGAEHDKLSALNWEYKSDIRQGAAGTYFATHIFPYIFDGMLREQYVIEKAVQEVSPDERGIIVLGVSHLPTMMRYLEDRHSSLQSRVIIPKHLYTEYDHKELKSIDEKIIVEEKVKKKDGE